MGSTRLFYRFILTVIMLVLWDRSFSAAGEEASLQTIASICGGCHGVIMNQRCVAGECRKNRTHTITPQPWELVVPWMKAMGCQMTQKQQEVITHYLMEHFEKRYPIQWEQAGFAPEGWNIVSFGVFLDRLYAGIEGSGGIFRLEDHPLPDGPIWKTVLNTPNYTVYGLTRFQDRFIGATNDPAAEIWASTDGEKWEMTGRLDKEKGITSVGVFKDFLYVGTTRASLYRSSDGYSWTPLQSLLPNAENRFKNWVRFILPYDDALFVGIESAGVYRSEDGLSWKKVWPIQTDRGKRDLLTGVRGAAVFNGVLYIGMTAGGEILALESKKGSRSTPVFQPNLKLEKGYVGAMAVFESYLYAGIDGTVFRTQDGKHWEEVGRLGPFTIEAIEGFDDQLYAGTTLPPKGWVYRTTGHLFPPGPVAPQKGLKP